MKKTAIVLASLVLSAQALFAAPPGGGRSAQQIDVKSDELFTDKGNRSATFVGKVVARQGDLTVYADRLTVFYAEKGGEVERIEADGNVRLDQGNRLGTGGHALYDLKEEKVTLTVDPRVQQGEDFVTGKVITYSLSEEKSMVTGGSDSRVRALIHPKGKGKDAGTKP